MTFSIVARCSDTGKLRRDITLKSGARGRI